MKTKWIVFCVISGLYLICLLALGLNVGSDAGQAMPISGLAFMMFGAAGIPALILLAVILYFT